MSKRVFCVKPTKSVNASRNYGGAYDIDPEMFFTRDDLDELAEQVMGYVLASLPGKFKLEDAYVDGSNYQDIFIEIQDLDDGTVHQASAHVDMRKIRNGHDLADKYARQLASDIIDSVEEYQGDSFVESATSIEGALPGPGDYSPPEYDEPELIDGEQECIQVDIDAYIIIDQDGSFEYEDEDYGWACSEGEDNWYSEAYSGLVLDDCIGVVEKIDDLIVDKLPDEPGRYHITGKASICYDISGVSEYAEGQGVDEDGDVMYETSYSTDYAEVEHVPENSKLLDFQCTAAGVEASTAIQASVSIDYPKEVNSKMYNLYSNATYNNVGFGVYYTLIDDSREADAKKMLQSFKAQVSEHHPYDEAPYVSAHLRGGVIKFIQNGSVVGQSSYSDADTMDVENEEWINEVITDAIVELREYNRSIRPKMSHN